MFIINQDRNTPDRKITVATPVQWKTAHMSFQELFCSLPPCLFSAHTENYNKTEDRKISNLSLTIKVSIN